MGADSTGGVGPQREPKYDASKKMRVKVSYAVLNKETGEWEKFNTTPGQSKAILEALGPALKSVKINDELSRGEVRITSGRVWGKAHEGRFQDLTSDYGYFSSGRKTTRKAATEATKIIQGSIGRRATLAIQVRVVPLTERLSVSLGSEEKYFDELRSQLQEVDSPQLRAVVNAQAQVVEIQREVGRLVAQEKMSEAEEYYTQNMPQAHGVYCDAMRDWGVDDGHLRAQIAISEELSDPKTTARIVTQSESFGEIVPFVQFAQGKYAVLMQEELGFLNHVSEVLESNTLDTDYREKLETLKEVAVETKNVLVKTQQFIKQGRIGEGIGHYQTQIKDVMPRYRQALTDLIVPRALGAGREGRIRAFSFDLDRISEHHRFLKDLDDKQTSLNLTKVDGGRPFNFDEALRLVDQEQAIFKEENLKPVALAFNSMKSGSVGFLATMGEFVKNFQEHRELFEAIMREEGFTDLESAALFNHFVTTHEAFDSWFTGLQKVIDLANMKDYEAAIERFADLVKENFKTLNQQVMLFIPFSDRFGDEKVERALKRFGVDTGASDPIQAHLTLNIARYSTSINMQLKDVKKAICKPLGIKDDKKSEDDNDNAFITGVEGFITRQTAQKFIDMKNEVAMQTAKNDEKVEGQSFLHLQGDEFKPLMELNNKLASCIQQLKEGEGAVLHEKDPMKKRALLSQLNQLGVRLKPDFDKIKQEYKSLGGDVWLAGLSDMNAEAGALSQLMRDQQVYEAEFYQRHHFYIPFEDNQIATAFQEGPPPGWTPQEIASLNAWFDAFNHTAHPIMLLAERLKEDPENIQYQHDLREAFKKRGIEITKLIGAFDNQFGSIERIRELPGGFAEKILRVNNSLKEVVEFIERKGSWEKGYLAELTDGHSQLAQVLEANFSDELTLRDVLAMQDLFENLQVEARKIHVLERRLEVFPENKRLRSELKREMEGRILRLNALQKKFGNLSEKIEKLQEVIDWIELTLNEGLVAVHEVERLGREVGPRTAGGQKEPLELLRGERLGGRTDEEVYELLDQCRRLDVVKAFREKTLFLNDVYKRLR